MMPNGERGGIFMMKTGEMKWNGGSQMSQNRENAAKLGKFFVALFQKTRANGKNEGERCREKDELITYDVCKILGFLDPSHLSLSHSRNLSVLLPAF